MLDATNAVRATTVLIAILPIQVSGALIETTDPTLLPTSSPFDPSLWLDPSIGTCEKEGPRPLFLNTHNLSLTDQRVPRKAFESPTFVLRSASDPSRVRILPGDIARRGLRSRKWVDD